MKLYFWSTNEILNDDIVENSSGNIITTDYTYCLNNNIDVIDNFTYNGIDELVDFLNSIDNGIIICWDLKKEYKVLSALSDRLNEIKNGQYLKDRIPMLLLYSNFKVYNLQTMIGRYKLSTYKKHYNIKNESLLTCNVVYNFLKTFDKDYFEDPDNLSMSISRLVRNYNKHLYKNDFKSYMRIIHSNIPKNAKQYKMTESAVWGGFGKSNFKYACNTISDDIYCFDITSQYPAIMLYKKYTIGTTTTVLDNESEATNWWNNYYLKLYNSITELNNNFYHTSFFRAIAMNRTLFDFLAIANVTINDIKVKDSMIDYAFIPSDKIENTPKSFNRQIFDGRIIRANEITFSLTMNDYIRLLEIYDFSNITINYVEYAKSRNTHPYIEKQIKGFVEEKQAIKNAIINEDYSVYPKDLIDTYYKTSKVKLNSIFGNSEKKYIYKEPNTDEELEELLRNTVITSNRMMGAYITAYGRDLEFALIDTCKQCGAEWLYSDTDSAYCICTKEVANKIEKSFNSLINSMTYDIGGVYKGLGLVEVKHYDRMKYVGRKAYYASENNNFDLHLAGIDLESYSKEMVSRYGIRALDCIINTDTFVTTEVAQRTIPDLQYISWEDDNKVFYKLNKDLTFTISDSCKFNSYLITSNLLKQQYGIDNKYDAQRYILTNEHILLEVE